MTVTLQVQDLCRFFGTTHALNQVSFHVKSGNICALLGPNGAGKTTLLKLMMGLIKPSCGEILLGEHSSWPSPSAITSNIGCLIDGMEPPSSTRIKHLVKLSQQIGPQFDADRVEQLLQQKQLSPNQTWRALSKGQKRWVLLAMLIGRGCRILLLDEPADGLDPASRQELYQLLRREANSRGTTVLVTTHIIHDVEKVADDVCILHQGKLELQQDLDELREQTLVVETEEVWEPSPGIVVLRQEQAEHCTYWLHQSAGDFSTLEIDTEIRRRRAGLEEIYLAVTRNADSRTHDKHHTRSAAFANT